MTTLVFAALARGDHAQGYEATFPDLPKAAAQGADMAQLVANAREAVLGALQGLTDQGVDWPTATPLEQVVAEAGAFVFLVDVSVEDTPLRVNISIGERLLKRIDQAAEARGMSRSGYIAEAAKVALGDRPGWSKVTDFDAIARGLQEEWSVLGRRLTDSLGPDSAFNRNMAQVDAKVTEALRKTADSVSAALARRQAAEHRAAAETETPPDSPAHA